MKRSLTGNLVIAAMMVALGLVLPFITGNIPSIGNMLSPMHLPVLLSGFVCGGPIAAIVGCLTPILRGALFGMPVLIPNGLCMAFELATYGFVAGTLFQLLKKNTLNVWVSLIGAMLAGRMVWGCMAFVLYHILGLTFTLQIFVAAVFLKSIPGIVLQLVLIPTIVLALRRAHFVE